MAPARAQEFQFDVETLLSPIKADKPAGVDLRYDAVYGQIRELRRQDDASLPMGVWKSEQKRADWHAMESICLETLETRSKDLQIAAWLLESWVELHGFAGAAQGFRVMHALCDSFWEDLHPRIDGGDAEFRIAPLVWLNRNLPTSLKLLPLTAPEAQGVAACTLADWEVAAHTANSQNRPAAQPAKDGAMTMARFQQSAILTPTMHLAAVSEEIGRLNRRCAEFEKLIDEKLGRESPGLSAVRGVGESASALLRAMLNERDDFQPAPAPDSFSFPGDGAEESEMDTALPGRIRTRSDAYRWLAEAADFLARTEPHSPTSYLVRRAIAWGSMSLEELLPELVRNQGELGEIFRLLNVRPAEGQKK
jgi:type VI secretion system ImpA family protein